MVWERFVAIGGSRMKQNILWASLLVTLAIVACGDKSRRNTLTEAYTDSVYGCSFRYPEHWKQSTPQAKATRILLRATEGPMVSCNLSVVKADEQSITDYNAEYFEKWVAPKLQGFILNRVWYLQGMGGETVAFVDFSMSFKLPSQTVNMRSLSVYALKDGNRFVLACRARPSEFKELLPVFEAVLASFWFPDKGLR